MCHNRPSHPVKVFQLPAHPRSLICRHQCQSLLDYPSAEGQRKSNVRIRINLGQLHLHLQQSAILLAQEEVLVTIAATLLVSHCRMACSLVVMTALEETCLHCGLQSHHPTLQLRSTSHGITSIMLWAGTRPTKVLLPSTVAQKACSPGLQTQILKAKTVNLRRSPLSTPTHVRSITRKGRHQSQRKCRYQRKRQCLP